MRKKYSSVEEFISDFPLGLQERMQKLRKIFLSLHPDISEGISYNIPTFKINGKYVIYFAAYKNHISIYPIIRSDPGLDKEISKYKKGKGTLQFPNSEELPFDLIKKIGKVRLHETLEIK
jgi:uncharacterized protein YdhG (YjbR/CyaY superfamily)